MSNGKWYVSFYGIHQALTIHVYVGRFGEIRGKRIIGFQDILNSISCTYCGTIASHEDISSL